MKLQNILLFTVMFFALSNLNALNLTNNTSWKSIKYIDEDGDEFIHDKKFGMRFFWI